MSVPTNRLAGLEGAALDAVVIGGGMAGAGVARDLALRGASVALFEKGDFASGTSSKSSKLIHGGLRYLELGDFKLVRESLREKKTLERLAPHLVRPLPFLVPVYRGAARGLITVRIGMWLYDLLTPAQLQLSHQMVEWWGAFTKFGAPVVPGQPFWPTDNHGQLMSLRPGDQSQVISGATFGAEHQCSFWDANPSALG